MTKPGDRIKILKGTLVGSFGIVSYVNKEKGTITVMVPRNQVHPDDRHKFIAKRVRGKFYVPLTLAEGEWEQYGDTRIILPR